MSSQEPQVYVVDDDPAVCESLVWLLEAEGMQVQTFDGACAFLKHCKTTLRGCALIDVRMPEMTGPELQMEMKSRGTDLPIIFITAFGNVDIAVQAIKAGAFDFVQKPLNDEEIIRMVSRAIAHDARKWTRQKDVTDFAMRMRLLTPRERDILRLVVDGRLSRQIALELSIEEKTVGTHRARIMSKTKARSTAHLVRMTLLVEKAMG